MGGETWECQVQTTNKSLAEGFGEVVHAHNPSTLGGQARQITRGQEFKTTLANMAKPHLY